LYLRLPDTRSNRKKAELLAKQIEIDISEGTYDPTLERYKAQLRPNSVDEKIRSQGESVVDLFQRFTDYKAKDVDARTVEKYRALLARLRPFFKDQRVDFVGVEKAKDFVEYLKDYQKPRTIRDRLATLSECWQWSRQDLDPWKLVKVKDDLKQKPKPFTHAEVTQILETFQSDRYYAHYYPYVYFLLNTGCRPAEAAGLRWGAIDDECTNIWIGRTITRGNKEKNTKTGEIRNFPCNEQMQAFLRDHRPANAQESDLVFPAPKGGPIGDNNFCKRAWTKVLEKAKIPYRKPYLTRSTFVSHCLQAGMSPAVVAELTGHDVKTLYRDYAGCIIARPQIPDLYQQ
jgi:integrase